MAGMTVRTVADRLTSLGMVTDEKAAAVLAGIAEWNAEHLDEDLDERGLISWLPEFGVAVSVHGDDVDFVEDYYSYMLEEEVTAVTGGAVVVSDVTLVRGESGSDKLHFRRNGESVWWHMEHLSEDYVDQGAVAEQISDVDPGGDDPRTFHLVERSKRVGCDDDVYVLATPQQARTLRDEFGLDFHSLDRRYPLRGAAPTAEPETVEWYMQQDRRTMTEPAKAFLDRWLSEMDSALTAWRGRFLPGDFPFDFSLGSLAALEPLVTSRFASRAEVKAAADDPFVVGAVRYIGETLIRNAPGHWYYRDVIDSMYDRVPTVRSNTPSAFWASVIPLHELSHLAADREPGTLAASIEPLHSAARSYADAQRGVGRGA
ncbi:hypothetical protein [Kibdelosporangium aridum]|uniref:Uncharacterized protein n=1 Tax=Kibdelosporangium aridum TaxID=2030 RepID=A0A1Y5WYH0_KIBAR|nr:hypothetical protein [Kibdelosporangium aridum]SMC59624.1 hypothetical protein SAMN05661093_00791 [Kibdelosporangium aridum]